MYTGGYFFRGHSVDIRCSSPTSLIILPNVVVLYRSLAFQSHSKSLEPTRIEWLPMTSY